MSIRVIRGAIIPSEELFLAFLATFFIPFVLVKSIFTNFVPNMHDCIVYVTKKEG